ncbi:hypothetical protein E4O71_06885, partial [Neisseria meningitidis]|nr:hypothetical protein [Neisseria meningitidis]MBG8824628.1 hypothetical protein [Neisseria meningitidis]
ANNTSTVSDYFRNIRAHSIHPRVSVGYDFGGWRIAADYASYRKWSNNKYSVNTKVLKENQGNRIKLKTENQGNGTFHASSSLGLSAIYDFKLNDKFDKFKPYIGARVAYGHVKHQVHSVETKTTIIPLHQRETLQWEALSQRDRVANLPITKATASAAWGLVSSLVSVSTSRPS